LINQRAGVCVVVSSIYLCSSSTLSCFASSAASPDQLADNALLYAELLRNTSSAALLCIVITVEYQTLCSFSECVCLSFHMVQNVLFYLFYYLVVAGQSGIR
jgi:hypothetical protein